MIEKMKYINLVGPMSGIDDVIRKYIDKRDIQLEYALKELSGEKDIMPIVDENPYADVSKRFDKYIPYLDEEALSQAIGNPPSNLRMTLGDAIAALDETAAFLEENVKRVAELESKKAFYEKVAEQLKHFTDIDLDLKRLWEFKYFNIRCGRMPVASYRQFEMFLYADNDVLLDVGGVSGDYAYLIYYTPSFLKDKVDSIFSSLHFERIIIPGKIDDELIMGTPRENYEKLMWEIERLNSDIKEAKVRNAKTCLEGEGQKRGVTDVYNAIAFVKEQQRLFDFRKYAARTKNFFFIFVGWVSEKEAEYLKENQEKEKGTVYIVENRETIAASKPPTKLKNPAIIRPFEFFVKMYGTPSYGELDPTPFLAVTYTLLFGIMFGDIGQGFVLILVGLFMRFKLKMPLGPILCAAGASSMIFGGIFGSFFGYEFHSLFAPADTANTNVTLIGAMAGGVLLLLISMVFNLINCIRRRDIFKFLFDPNGVAGFLFYATALAFAATTLLGVGSIPAILLVITGIIPLVAIAVRHPLASIIAKKKPFGGGAPLGLLELVIELFEVMLTYFTNTMSFVRVGAFALSHASMMYVVWMLAETGSGYNPVVLILGNVLVMVLEGLIVGIQVLRLEFYEMFSRFYEGAGREFKSLYPKKGYGRNNRA